MFRFVFLVLLALSSAHARQFFDLTHTFDENAPKWNMPDSKDKIYYKMTELINRKMPTYTITYNFVEFFEHMGTHFDAPGHFVPGKQAMHEIPAQQLIGPGVIIDVKAKAATNSTYGVTVGDIQDYEKRYGRIPTGAIIIMNSGWGLKYPDKEATFGTSDLNSMANFRFPGWTLEAAELVMTHRQAKVVGVDTPSIDVATDLAKPVHVLLLGNNIPVLEYAANLDSIPPNGTTIFLGAIKTRGGSGGPVRAVAILDEKTVESSHCPARLISVSTYILTFLLALSMRAMA